ncbi:outer membrane transport energization protein ExbD (TC 2.C.1.1.1) [Desulfatibacillum alkenivorans DSM 16219]|jgi:biopolymer transport protein ExbD|uniref:Outer membrane transport energization protein ExbD (TC 2.C.1.1.1) n=1 Tax=Desulfatibacillum alkenivorans DSM 16219 TaxID=1121393 RepID=A0A1M6NAU6_9BACT|nr:biopolymer transporter ExbD [Desulfatibacillum alkenivorans]SHJ92666.1 outer membrane transport energization protein ExbD (TC 2.C.1.1.1) [Desulfatibacillum alkenivorans DSM 16219]
MLSVTNARRAKRQTLELNIAPLIDMVFILLIFFLVTTSFVRETGLEVNRPSAQTAASSRKTNILVGISDQNAIFMNHRQVDIRSVRAQVERGLVDNPGAAVVVVADQNATAGTIVSVMDAARLAGAENVTLAASAPGGQS